MPWNNSMCERQGTVDQKLGKRKIEVLRTEGQGKNPFEYINE